MTGNRRMPPVFCYALAVADPSCDLAQFLHSNGSCVACPTCGPGEQLSEDCGYGDGGEGRCVACGEGEFSAEEGLAPCWQCTQCSLLNREERAPCAPTSNAECGRCLRGYYEMKRKSGVTEALCMPCYSPTGKIRKECHPPSSLKAHISTAGLIADVSRTQRKEDPGRRAEPVPVSMALIGSVSAAMAFLLVHLLWVLLLTVERLKQGPKCLAGQEDLSGPQSAESLHMLLPCSLPCATPSATPPAMPSHEGQTDQRTHSTEDTPRCLHSLNPEKDLNSPSIVINLTTNIKPSCQGGDSEWEGREGASRTPEAKISMEEMELKLEEICTVTKGQTLEKLDYDTVQDLSLLLDAGGRGDGIRRLGQTLSVPPEVLSNLRGFQDLFQYLRTSTYTLLPQLARAVASLPRPDIISRLHRGLGATSSSANANTQT
ncbi:tumor necrosis factor receptor superfamily member EDAR-like [Anguilla rostrata]|uniref:tumor necrosis factor receptor superfamily member EDAR-like n=1 Tax=Anguilla rostrata TaxID=7938 RepID=UPI0030D3BE73